MVLALRRRPTEPSRTQTAHMPAPLAGLNTISPASALEPSECLVLYNMLAGENGLAARAGYEEWVTGIGEEVRTLISFKGSASDGTKDRLWACTTTGIWDCTSSTATPTQVVIFPTQDGNSGYGRYTSFVNTVPEHWLCYCDESNGYYAYAEATDTWAKVAAGLGANQINGVDPANFSAVMGWKNRLWFIQKDTQIAWYTAIGALFGTVQPFYFGSKFKYGGDLVGLWNWTIDGGAGVDDMLVAISSSGDLIIYQGTDPSSVNTFALKGVWYLGGVPVGRRIASDVGGDLLILSQLGLLPLSKLVAGQVIRDPNIYATAKITNLFTNLMSVRKNILGWDLKIHPNSNGIVLTLPAIAGTGHTGEQLFMSLTTRGWSYLQDLPMTCAESWAGDLYFGTVDGRVCINTGTVDNTQLTGTTNTVAINWSLITSFQNLGSARIKRVNLIRPFFATGGTVPNYRVGARYNFDLTGITGVSQSVQAGSLWGTASWGISLWGAGSAVAGRYQGGSGLGSNVAVALAGSSIDKAILIGFDLAYSPGGIL